MVDIHAHILPGLDDGAGNLKEAADMAAMAGFTGTHHMVAASHCSYHTYDIRGYIKALNRLRKVLYEKKIPVTLYPGMEILLDENTQLMVESGRFLPVNGTDYLLVEFPFNESTGNVCSRISMLQKLNYRIILAHPERYYFMQRDPGLAYFLERKGCVLQINKESLSGGFGVRCRELAHGFLRNGIAGVIASDAHGTEVRTPAMGKLAEVLMKSYRRRDIHIWLSENPSRILKGYETIRLRGIER
ncbi:tyrosine-protein phosphatase [Murimonas intestini]|uniref:protein-tyrosine-phosphatase n=1 Tax=Murimonas intestini TaxID=1337051 RepID=A0AB73T8C2_9FIRM|nr:CpsB/CapC family capsule biosynthesis tyrosine phosphatase [Murimonas intestini]MCR1839786.1 hypothetical protein [Murimonas intestini]MCR1866628.1 hypothetical protein [Murimonas intestini]MCR1884748.1 hypothetical protein [Murimonas intestini]